ncbi:hypothetical protein Ddye_016527 [Dipteronia dyeriana]|uniref:Reverse transcriptase zinc-binding domain-containing protein n=1 Tax=Dipteronia dyeriana TaxID=168575 RepID=A0AAD9X055_9ROSI|nr:hypothetical protein Ddye_016527 [Dipteronia dyeriana]
MIDFNPFPQIRQLSASGGIPFGILIFLVKSRFSFGGLRNVIPSLLNFLKQNIMVYVSCRFCDENVESVPHALIWCKNLQKVWGSTRFDTLLESFRVFSVVDVMLGLRTRFVKDDLALFRIIL